MSAIKRYLEDLCTTITTAVTDEIMDMPECLEFTDGDVEEETMIQITEGNFDDLFGYLNGCITEASSTAEMPKTLAAMKALIPHVSDECLKEFEYTRDPDSIAFQLDSL